MFQFNAIFNADLKNLFMEKMLQTSHEFFFTETGVGIKLLFDALGVLAAVKSRMSMQTDRQTYRMNGLHSRCAQGLKLGRVEFATSIKSTNDDKLQGAFISLFARKVLVV